MRAIQQTGIGGAEVLELADLPVPAPQDGQVLVRITTAGVNFADTLIRRGLYARQPPLPTVPGLEIAGVREDTGQRVVAISGTGGYAEWAVAPKEYVFPVPLGVDDRTALALLIQGLTAWGLCHACARIASGETVVVHGGAGGVGSIALQLAKSMGARVIATASTEAKRTAARELGADAALDGDAEGLAGRLLEANDGRPVDVVLESVGGSVFTESVQALGPFGRLINYGTQSGQTPDLHMPTLMNRCGLVGGFYLFAWMRLPEAAHEALSELFDRTLRGELRPVLHSPYALEHAAEAQLDVEARRTVGKVVLAVS